MGITSFPGGFQNGVLIRGLPIQSTHPGEIFYVNNSGVLVDGGIGGSDRNKGTYLQPFATINHAISKCTASRGDIIMVMPGHQETVSTLGGIDLNVAGVAIIGLGTYDLRPKIIIGTVTAADITVTAANCTMYNIVVEAAFTSIFAGVEVTTTGCTLLHLDFTVQSSSTGFIRFVFASNETINGNDGLYISNCNGYSQDLNTEAPIKTSANIKDLVVEHCHFNVDTANAFAMIKADPGDIFTNCRITHNHYQTLKTSGDILVDNNTITNDGVIAYNTSFHLDFAGEVNIDCTGAGLFENYASGAFDVQGYLNPVADS